MKVFVCFAAALSCLALLASAQNSTELDGGSRDGRKRTPIAASTYAAVNPADAAAVFLIGTAGTFNAIQIDLNSVSVAATTANVRHVRYDRASRTLTYKVYITTLSTSGTSTVTYTPAPTVALPAPVPIVGAAPIPFTLSFRNVVAKVSVPNVDLPIASQAPATLMITSATVRSATIGTTGVVDGNAAVIDMAFNSQLNSVLRNWIAANPARISTFVQYYIGKI